MALSSVVMGPASSEGRASLAFWMMRWTVMGARQQRKTLTRPSARMPVMRSERAVALPLVGNAAGEVSCARREPMVWVIAHAMSRRSRRVGVGSPLPAASAWMRDEAWASVASRSALALWTVAGSRSAVLDTSMVYHALARVSVAAMSAIMRLGSSVFIGRPHAVVVQHL